MNFFDVIFLSIVEGITEFLPISSTGHLILTSKILGIEQDSFQTSFQIAIQLGSILAVVFLFWQKFLRASIWLRLIVAFIPTGFCGLFLYKYIRSLFDANIVAYMLIIGGILFIILELYLKDKSPKVQNLESISLKKAFLIGCFQSLAMVPGTSRSGATIFGGLILRLDRKVATEFSFLLAVPTMIIAVSYDTYKHIGDFSNENIMFILIGMLFSFIFALVAIKTLLRFISKFSYISFGIYRIFIGTIFLIFIL
ncbi:undecaprenyl-diphosphatase [Helicobacter sp. 16-1353]|uniref:undecaprenyl-diphosphate phosphatase n=1 Tax=Helicobacter sp. 16-1353 TaxID=2004996 RepID=UPI000DCE0129|nr:undecaprenyl-diphosphate phosphatase [Helicobacter sp. 16-1353]RAX53862.1 undecaprenyl-diphosphatase [Helicobacter sp. 16-1353]